jgi:hypothetical protein
MRWLVLIWLLFLAAPLKAEQLPEMRPALMGTGPRSMVNMINTERLMKRGQKDAMVMFTALVSAYGACWQMATYRGTPDSKQLAKAGLSSINRAIFIPAVYNHKRCAALVAGTIIYRVIGSQPHLHVYLNQESERILRGEDFISPQWVSNPAGRRSGQQYLEPVAHTNVVIRISVDVTGKLQDAKLMFETPPGKGIGRYWLNEVRAATFLPGYLHGNPVACSANIENVSFRFPQD